MVFLKAVDKSKCKPNRLQADQGRKFYNKLMQIWLDDNGILMHLINNEGRSVLPESFTKTLKGKIRKCES